jgi:hypothetical protein
MPGLEDTGLPSAGRRRAPFRRLVTLNHQVWTADANPRSQTAVCIAPDAWGFLMGDFRFSIAKQSKIKNQK